jgi:ABC-2 type transport system ATP-binding protein
MADPGSIWPYLQVNRLCGRYGRKPVLHDLSFSLHRGSVLGLFGPNGSGKSTLMRYLALIARPDGGQILIDQRDAWSHVAELRRTIGYVPQDIALFEELSVLDNLLCWTRLPYAAAQARARQIADELNLGDLLKQRVANLSGGMKRWVNLAVALMGAPTLLVLDEPFAGVDSEHSAAIEALLLRLASQGVSQIISGHHPDQILKLADQLLVLKQGRLVFSGGKDTFIRQAPGGGSALTLNTMLREAP